MGFQAFPTTFPTDAAKRIGTAILNRTFDVSLIEPIYDLVGYALYEVLGGAMPSPTPEPPTPVVPAKKLMTGSNAYLTDETLDSTGRMLLAACDAHFARAGSAPEPAKAIPWGTVLNVLFTIVQALVLVVSPNPFIPPQPAPDTDAAK